MPLDLILVDSVRALVVGSLKLCKAPASKLDLLVAIGHSYLRFPTIRDDSIDGNGYLAAESSQHATALSLTANEVKPTAGIELLQGLLRITGLVFLGAPA